MTEPRPPSILCHPDGRKSCGACCGMYNRRDADRVATLDRLAGRTLAFRKEADVGDPDSLAAFRARWETVDPAEKLLSELPNCPFLGFVDLDADDMAGRDGRVGCLVHPLQNDGVDGRDCGVYDRFICEDYLCAAHEVLRPIEAWLVVESVTDSYLYGLVITDPKFVRELFEQTARTNGAMPSAGRVMEYGVQAASAYFALKGEWPHRAEDGIFGQVRAGDGLETPRRTGPSAELGVQPDRWEPILRCLGTWCRDEDELTDARSRVAATVRRFADAVAIS